MKEQCAAAKKELHTKSIDHETVHEVRKHFKKLRASHRLIRDYSNFYKKENTFFRDEAKKLSDLRDASAILEILEKIRERYQDELYKNTFTKVREALIERKEIMWNSAFEEQQGFKPILKKLHKKCEEYDHLSIKIFKFEEIRPSIHRVYSRGFDAYKASTKKKEKEIFHEWRKRAKYLRYQLKMLKELWKPIYKKYEDELHRLSDLLGNDQDLYHLKTWLKDASLKISTEENHF